MAQAPAKAVEAAVEAEAQPEAMLVIQTMLPVVRAALMVVGVAGPTLQPPTAGRTKAEQVGAALSVSFILSAA